MRMTWQHWVVISSLVALVPACNDDDPDEECFGPRPTEPPNGALDRFCRMESFEYKWPEEKDGARAYELSICEPVVLGDGACALDRCDIEGVRQLFLDELESNDSDVSQCIADGLVDFVPVCLDDLPGLEERCCFSAVVYADCPPLPEETP